MGVVSSLVALTVFKTDGGRIPSPVGSIPICSRQNKYSQALTCLAFLFSCIPLQHASTDISLFASPSCNKYPHLHVFKAYLLVAVPKLTKNLGSYRVKMYNPAGKFYQDNYIFVTLHHVVVIRMAGSL